MRHIEIAEAHQDELISLIKFFAVVAFVVHNEGAPKEICKQAKVWGTEGKEVVKLFGVQSNTFIRLVNLVPTMDKFDNLAASQWESVDRFCSIMYKTLRSNSSDADEIMLSIPQELLNLLGRSLLAIHAGSEPAYRNLAQKIGSLQDPRLSAIFTPGGMTQKFTVTQEYKGALRNARAYVKKWAGINAVYLPIDVAPAVREKDPDGYKEYLANGRVINASYKDAVRQIIRSSGKPLIDIHDLGDALDKMGVIHKLPEDFDGKLDDQLKFYTTTDELLLGTPSGEVTMNPAWEDDEKTYYCTYLAPGAAKPSKLYQANVVQERKSAKFDATRLMVDSIESFRAKWVRAMKGSSPSSVPALLCEIAYLVSPRIGTEGNSTKIEGKSVSTYGISTIRTKHVKFRGTTCVITYMGKAGEKQQHIIPSDTPTNKIVVRKIRELVADRAPNDFVFVDDDNKPVGSRINPYLKSLGVPDKFRFHGFRKVRGSVVMKEFLNTWSAKSATPKEVNDFVQEGLKAVGAQLGHFSNGQVTGATALKSYVDGDLLYSFFLARKVRPSPVIEKAIKESRSEE